MSNDCVILFDQNEYGTYFTGQTVTGKVIITLPKTKKFKGIKLQISGFAACQWQEKRGNKYPIEKVKKKKKNMYFGREDYIASTTFLVGSEEGQPFAVDAGTHTYTFTCPIPVNCPSSFEGTYGHIRYLAKVTFIRSGSSNRVYNMPFTVLKLLDLNQDSRLLKSPVNNEAMENFCLFQSKALHLRINLPQSGFVPGQIILVSTHVQNDSNFDCKKLVILLNLRATYTSDAPRLHTAYEKINLVKKVCGPVQSQTTKDFPETIRVPATAPTCEHLSKVVRVSYEICVIAMMNHFIVNPKATVPITIGNVPLTEAPPLPSPTMDDVPTTSACAMQRAVSVEHSMYSEQITTNLEDEIIDLDADGDGETEEELDLNLPPPSYEQAVFMTRVINDNDTEANTICESTRYTPRYPVYDVDGMAEQTPPPNKPQKRRRKKKKRAPPIEEIEKERPPVESPIQI